MAYFTELNSTRELTPGEHTTIDNYVSGQVTAGTTDGNLYQWTISESNAIQTVRMWGTIESANGYKALAAGFTPPIDAKVF
jgi:hypothetical protein